MSGSGLMDKHWPLWLQDVALNLRVRPQFVLWGNIRDRHLVGDPLEAGSAALQDTIGALWLALAENGYSCLLVYDPIDGLMIHPEDSAAQEIGENVVGDIIDSDKGPLPLGDVRRLLSAVADTKNHRVALVFDYASRLAEDPSHLAHMEPAPEVFEFFRFCEKLSHRAEPSFIEGQGRTLYNPIIWLANGERDLPHWLTVGNDGVRMLSVPSPHFETRTPVARLLLTGFEDWRALSGDEQQRLVETFAALTEGLTLSSMTEIAGLALDRQLPSLEIADAIQGYKVGIPDDPWKRPHLPERIARAEDVGSEYAISRRVLGQPLAIRKALDILKRSVTGLTGAHAKSRSARPRGVLFFAGPTGVGKTELAKAITELVFDDENSMVRFDMSEFAAEHTDQRLIGAPPSYVGYEAGGELTNAVRQRPFCLVLFDEIEKAHARILDKFLQLLDEGRLTDGRGSTVHFTQTIIVFTSNEGMDVPNDEGKLPSEEWSYEDFDPHLRKAIQDKFKNSPPYGIGRPELLNRIGPDNIVVFDFIRPDVAEDIFEQMLENIKKRLQDEQKVELVIPDTARKFLLGECTKDLSLGGRGIANTLDTVLVNPLARTLFAYSGTDSEITIREVTKKGGDYEVEIE